MRRLIISSAGFLLLIAVVHPASGQVSVRGSKAVEPSGGVRPEKPDGTPPVGFGRIVSRPVPLPPNPPSETPQNTSPASDKGDNTGAPNGGRQNQGDDRRADRGDGSRDRGRPGHGHHHHHHGGGPWIGYPWVWGTPYYPGIYYPSASIYGYNVGFGYNLGLPAQFDPNPVVVPQNNAANNVANNGAANRPAPAPVPADALRTTNPEQRARAGRFLGFGDAQFAKQKYLAAVGRYKTAIETAPDLADGYLRQGFAHVALGQYENAAKAFKRALAVRDDWRGAPFRLEQLYVDAPISKTQHLENLAKAVEENPFDADLLLVLGLELYFDDQRDSAAVFLSRVAQFGGDEALVKHFLQQPKPAGAPDPDPPRAGGKVVF